MKTGTDENTFPTRLARGSTCVVTKDRIDPSNTDTTKIHDLIGKPFTRFEILADATIYLEFSGGSITIAPSFGCAITAAALK